MMKIKIKRIGIMGGTTGIGKSFFEFFNKKDKEEKEIKVTGRNTKITNKDIIETCDLVIFSVPITNTKKVITEVLPYSHPNQILVDFTSLKVFPVKTMLKSKSQVCGLHPMFGPFSNISEGKQKIIFTPARITSQNLIILQNIFSEFTQHISTPEEHDELMGIIQGVSHFSDFITGVTIKNLKVDFRKVLNFSSPPYKLKLEVMGRMFAQNSDLYSQIMCKNATSIAFFSSTVKKLQSIIEKKDNIEIANIFHETKNYLGHKFCTQAQKNSQRILEWEQYKQKDSFITDLNKSDYCDLVIFGDKNSHTDEASNLFSYRKKNTKIHYTNSIFQVFVAINKNQAPYGIVPYENSTKGSVCATLEAFIEYPEIKIIDAQKNYISHHLLALPSTKLTDIKKIYSHTQALDQCGKWLRNNLPDVEIITASSTALAAQKIKKDQNDTVAAIGSLALSNALDLDILASELQEENNSTRFICIAKKTPPHNSFYVSFVFWFSGDRVGNLAKVLTIFSTQKINLSKIDSRRAAEQFGNYLFFVDAECSISNFKKIIPKIENIISGIQILGSFN